MKLTRSCKVIVVLVALCSCSIITNAEVIINIGDSVDGFKVQSDGGTIDLSGATQVGTGGGSGLCLASNLIGMDYGSNIKYRDYDSSNVTIEFSENWTSSGYTHLGFSESSAGSWMLGYYAGMLLVPQAASSIEYNPFTGILSGSYTSSSLGLTENSWVKVSWGNAASGTDDYWKMNVIPEPSVMALSVLFSGGIFAVRRIFMI